MTTPDRQAGQLARVITSDLVEYFRAPGSALAGSEVRAREFAAHGLGLLRARFGEDDVLERYYGDCVASAFESLMLAPPSLARLRVAAAPRVVPHPPEDRVSLVFGRD